MKRENINGLDISTGVRVYRANFVPEAKLLGDHFHSEVEIVYVESGEIIYTVDGEDRVLPSKSLLVVGSGIVHRLKASAAEAEVVYMQADIERAYDSMLSELSLFSFFCDKSVKKYGVFPLDSPIAKIFFAIVEEAEQKDIRYDMAVKGLIYQLIAFMCREGLIADVSSLLQDASYRKILPAIEYAKQNFMNKITLDTLCGHLYIDKYNFCKQFKAVTETTFFDYLCHLRIKHACELLADTDKTITEIALSCGFVHPQYFTRVFISRMKYSPTVYRRMRKTH